GHAVEKEHALDDLVGVLHLVDGLVVRVLGEDGITPVLAHPRMDEVLVDAGQLLAKHLIEQIDDARITLHVASPAPAGRPGGFYLKRVCASNRASRTAVVSSRLICIQRAAGSHVWLTRRCLSSTSSVRTRPSAA